MTPDNITYFSYLWEKTMHYFEIKTLAAILITSLGFLFDSLQTEALIGLFVLIIIDFVFGVGAAYRTKTGIESSKILRTAVKMTVYFALIAASHISEAAIPIFKSFLDETITGFLAATELISILENTGRMGYAVPKKLMAKLNSFTKKI